MTATETVLQRRALPAAGQCHSPSFLFMSLCFGTDISVGSALLSQSPVPLFPSPTQWLLSSEVLFSVGPCFLIARCFVIYRRFSCWLRTRVGCVSPALVFPINGFPSPPPTFFDFSATSMLRMFSRVSLGSPVPHVNRGHCKTNIC